MRVCFLFFMEKMDPENFFKLFVDERDNPLYYISCA